MFLIFIALIGMSHSSERKDPIPQMAFSCPVTQSDDASPHNSPNYEDLKDIFIDKSPPPTSLPPIPTKDTLMDIFTKISLSRDAEGLLIASRHFNKQYYYSADIKFDTIDLKCLYLKEQITSSSTIREILHDDEKQKNGYNIKFYALYQYYHSIKPSFIFWIETYSSINDLKNDDYIVHTLYRQKKQKELADFLLNPLSNQPVSFYEDDVILDDQDF